MKALARAYRDLFQMSGEAPRPAYFDDQLVMALKAGLAELSDSEIFRQLSQNSSSWFRRLAGGILRAH